VALRVLKLSDEDQPDFPAYLGAARLWPQRILGPPPGLKGFVFVCWALLLTGLVPFVFLLSIRWKMGSLSDFVYFYGDGRIANEYSPSRFYDYGLQLKIFDEIDPTRGALYGPSPYPPFVPLFFGIFARLPLRAAYLAWIAISFSLYVVGIREIVREVFPAEPLKRSLVFVLAFAFSPFLMNDFANGQIASLAVFSLGLAIALDRRSQPFQGGIALSILCYKPTLLLLIIPMLLLGRKFRTFAGLCIGSLMLFLVTTAIDGIGIWRQYAEFLIFFGRVSRSNVLRRWQFVDLNSLSYEIGERLGLSISTIVLVFVCVCALWLFVLFWRAAKGNRDIQDLVWANALTWTLLLNVYVPIYDSISIVIAFVLTIGVLFKNDSFAYRDFTVFLALLMLVISWKTLAIAQHHGVQVMTLLLIVIGIWQGLLLQAAISQGSTRAREVVRA
jgi:hypothetical protein